jgi:hypothetical protein
MWVLLCFVVLQVWGGIRSDAGLTRSVSGCIPTRSGGTIISFPAGTRGVGAIKSCCVSWCFRYGEGSVQTRVDAERQWLHSHAERGNDHQLSSGDAGRGNDQVLLCFVVLQVWGGIRSGVGLTRSVSGCIPTRSGGTISFPAGTRGVDRSTFRQGRGASER